MLTKESARETRVRGEGRGEKTVYGIYLMHVNMSSFFSYKYHGMQFSTGNPIPPLTPHHLLYASHANAQQKTKTP